MNKLVIATLTSGTVISVQRQQGRWTVCTNDRGLVSFQSLDAAMDAALETAAEFGFSLRDAA